MIGRANWSPFSNAHTSSVCGEASLEKVKGLALLWKECKMECDITARHCELSDALKERIQKRLLRLAKLSNHVISCHAILEKDGSRQVAALKLQVGRTHLSSKETSYDMYEALDGATDKIETQLRRHEDRIKNHKFRERPME